ncbi:hypothetical protein [Microbacterium oleivorans]|uniref:Uncharacterized protein n=1 Tax=Microbacterium oleivorans TaxID=273677 RepID=A0A7D5IUH7_9MICO|nr:hypothetical protein [Microbacterium oleivorans]QLD10302.1 hypothetical protein HW566_00025 [Microbacterium oleivorans]
MGLFTQRPEEPSEWAGLPSEPVRPRSGAELLPDVAPPADALGGLLGQGGVASIPIPLAVPTRGADGDVPPASDIRSADGDDTRDGDGGASSSI